MRILVCDLPLRLFHWSLVVTMVAVYVTGKWGGLWLYWHVQLGLVVLALVVFRVAWGFLGSTYARFRSFFPTPTRVRAYLSAEGNSLGHSPLASIAIFLMLTLMLLQTGSGLFASNDEIEFHGPLNALISSDWSERFTGWHHQGVTILLILTGLHVLAIGYYTGIRRHNLILPMITGNTTIPQNTTIQPPRGAGLGQFLLAVGLAGFVFWCIESGTLLRWVSAGTAGVAATTPSKFF